MSKITYFNVKLNDLNFRFQPDCSCDLVLVNRFNFRKLQTFQNKTIQLIKDNTKFFAANLSRVFVDGYFWGELKTESGAKCKSRIYVINVPDKEPPLLNEETLLELGLISYNPEGKSIKSIAIKTPVKEDSLPTIKFDNPEIAKNLLNYINPFRLCSVLWAFLKATKFI